MALCCTVLGAGSWGTALAVQLAQQGHQVKLWDRNPERCEAITENRKNPHYLTEIDLPENIQACASLANSFAGAQLVVGVVPSHGLGAVWAQAREHIQDGAVICCASKGIEDTSLQTMYQVMQRELGHRFAQSLTVLSGPTFALELARGLPSAAVSAGPAEPAQAVADAFHGGAFRVYHTEDVTGVCVGGSIKNKDRTICTLPIITEI